MLLGCFSSYFTTLVRSNANPSVDMYNVDNPVSLVGYLSREQYGDWPILYGQDFTADPENVDVEETYEVPNLSLIEGQDIFEYGYTKLKEKLVTLYGAENIVDC
jgi:hypothetical protein